MTEILGQFSEAGPLLGLACASFFFGVVLKLSDLLQEHGYRWFRGSANATGALSAALGTSMLALGGADLHHLWIVVVASWIVRGRIDGLNHAMMALAILAFHGIMHPEFITEKALTLYFALTLVPLGAVHDLLQYTGIKAPAFLKWFFRNQHLYWYLVGLGYLLFFSQNLEVPISIYAFVKGYGFLYEHKRDAWLGRLGVQCPVAD